MYRCEICQNVSRPNEPRRTHVISRTVPRTNIVGTPIGGTRQEIARELAVCEQCHHWLGEGVPLRELCRDRGKVVVPVTEPVVPRRTGVSILRKVKMFNATTLPKKEWIGIHPHDLKNRDS